MPFKAKSRSFRDGLVALLQAIKYDVGTGPEDAFALVTGDPAKAFKEEPYALVYPAPIEDVKGAIGQNDRTVNFSIIILLEMENEARTQSQTYDYMYDLTELVLDALDEGDFTDALNQTDGHLGSWLMNATRGSFLPAETKAGAALLCTIDVAISYSKDL